MLKPETHRYMRRLGAHESESLCSASAFAPARDQESRSSTPGPPKLKRSGESLKFPKGPQQCQALELSAVVADDTAEMARELVPQMVASRSIRRKFATACEHEDTDAESYRQAYASLE